MNLYKCNCIIEGRRGGKNPCGPVQAPKERGAGPIVLLLSFLLACVPTFAQLDTCNIDYFPFSQDFEEVAVGQLPYCWSYWNTYTSYQSSNAAQVSSLTARSGQHSLRFKIGGYVNLPVLNSYPIQDMELRLWVSTANITVQSIYSVTISVGVMSNGTFQTHPTNTRIFDHQMEPGEFVLCTFHFDWVEEDANQIVIYVNNMLDDCFIDDVELIYEPCSNPQNLTVDNSLPGQAMLTWDAGVLGSAVNYLVTLENMDNYSWQQLTTTNTYFELDNLEEQTLYRVSLSANCGPFQSTYPDTITFLTQCINPTAMTVDRDPHSVNAVPLDLWSSLTYSQQLYLREELDTVPRKISAIAFKYIAAPASCRASVYLAHVTDSFLFSHFIQASDSVDFKLVLRRTIDWYEDPDNEWFVLQLDSTFEYDGVRNLLLVCYAHGVYTNQYGPFFVAHPTSQQLYALCYNSNYGGWLNPLHPGAPNHYSTYRSNVRFIYCDENTCVPPAQFYVNEVDCKSVELSWMSGDSAWEVAYRAVDDSIWTLKPVYTTAYLLDSLQPNTNYLVKVRTNCGDTVSSWSEVRSFRTTCVIETLPYRQTFDDEAEDIDGSLYLFCWNRMAGPSGGLPYITSQQNNFDEYYSSPYALYFPQGSLQALAVLPPVADTINIADLRLSFMWKTIWGVSQYYEIGLMTDAADPGTFVPIDTVRWTTGTSTPSYYFCDFADYQGEARYIAIRGTNQASFSPYNYVDDVELDYNYYCPRAVIRNIDLVTATTARVQWDCDTSAHQWVLEYGPVGFAPGTGQVQFADSNPFVLTGLTPDTQYDVYVRSICDDGDTGRYWRSETFTTEICDAEDRCKIILSAGISTSSYWPNTYMGKVDVVCDGTVLQEFTMVSGYTEEIELCDDKDIVLLWRENEQGTTADLAVLDADLDTLAFYPNCNHNTVGDTIYATHLDCFHSGCPQPYDFYFNVLDQSSVDVIWNPGGSETAWTLRYRQLHSQEWTEVSTTAFLLHLDSLIQNTWYEVWLRAECADTLSSLWYKGMFRTNPCPNSCDLIFDLRDSWGDGWNGSLLDVVINNTVAYQLTVEDTFNTFNLSLCLADEMRLVWHKGGYDNECSVVVLSTDGDTLYNRAGFAAAFENQTIFTDSCYIFHTITSYSGEGGAINPEGVFQVMSGQNILFTIVPDSGYIISNVIVDGESVGLDPDLELLSVTEDHTVYAEFEQDGNGIDEHSLSLMAYPSPATHTVTVVWESGIKVSALEVIDIYGHIVRVISSASKPSQQTRIDVSDLASGVYFIRVNTDRGTVTKPFVKR